MISHDPSYAGGYLAVALADKHKGNAPAAAQEFATAQRLWSKADPLFGLQNSRILDLPEP
jgi:hypothetical protein